MRVPALILVLLAAITAGAPQSSLPDAARLPSGQTISFSGLWQQTWNLNHGQAVEIGVRISRPSALPPNGRIEVRWEPPSSAAPATGWQKVLHALDPDVCLIYRAPVPGVYTLRLETITDRPQALGETLHDTGLAPLATPLPTLTPALGNLDMVVELRSVGALHNGEMLLEAEPNDTPDLAVNIPFVPGNEDQVIRVFGGSDDLEYYNNTRAGRSGEDWYRIDSRGSRRKILTANLQMVEPVVSARIRVYRPGVPTPEELAPREIRDSKDFGNNQLVPYVHPPVETIPGAVPVYSYYDGRDINERPHQQDTNFRSFVTREVVPGGVYYLRVEANQPGYELELRLIDPAPYDDPRRAIRQAIYYHLAEIDAWLIHRPRNIALDRRVRDGTSLFGENCMSCHTQSGVWGVADAFRNGYRPDGTAQNWRRLVNTMYESLRPTVKLADAASNTSLAPNDLGDAPAGSRVAGRNIVLHERAFPPKRLHSHQQRRTANYVLQTADPPGINAAGRGSNFGPNVVFKFAAEILERAWRDTNDPKYRAGLEEKARKIVETGDDKIKVVDDYGHRIEFFYRLWPKDSSGEFHQKFRARAEKDIERLLALQNEDGSWGLNPVAKDPGDPAPTAVSLIGLHAAGRTADDSAVARAVQWLLKQQYPYGLWNRSAQTGFVTTAYVIRALSQLYPEVQPPTRRTDRGTRQQEESFLASLSSARLLQTTSDKGLAGQMIAATRSEYAQVRYYGLLGLGGALAAEAVPVLIHHLDDPVKFCREAAFWSLRQLLLDDQGWPELFEAYRGGSDRARQSILQALVTRADLVGPKSRADLGELARVLVAGMSDPFAGARAWAYKAAWHWWVWNPPLRDAINRAWIEALAREEQEALVEAALRYSTVSLLIANGQIANQTGGKNQDQQYRELGDFYRLLAARRASADSPTLARLDRRLMAVAASHFEERGSDGGPGQLGYSTPGAAGTVGRAVLATYEREVAAGPVPWKRIALQAAANVNYPPLEQHLLTLVRTAPREMAAAAARSLVNPQSFTLPATVETIDPLLEKLAPEAVASFLGRVRWDFTGVDTAQETGFFRRLIAAGPAYARILADNQSLHRKAVFGLVSEGDRRFWLPSTEWMLAFQDGAATLEEAVKGATEAENLQILELTFGRTTDQIVPNGMASRNTILWWREGRPGERLSFAVDAPAAGRYEILAGFLYDRDYARVQFALNGLRIGEPMDFYKPVLSSTGPVSLGVHEFRAGLNHLTVEIVDANSAAEPNYVFAFDYIKITRDAARGSALAKDDRGVEVRDPLTVAKNDIVGMFTAWFSANTPRETREAAINAANRVAVRRNPQVRAALAAYVASEPILRLQERIQNILNSDDETYRTELRRLIADTRPTGLPARKLEPTDEFISDVLYFRDAVFAEMNRNNPEDNRACISCHSVPGRVPTLYLDPPDAAGYIAPAALLENYRRMQQRVDTEDVEKSRFLRKPLNVQTGSEDGHQGGTRFAADAPGYQIIRDWVLKQSRLQKQ